MWSTVVYCSFGGREGGREERREGGRKGGRVRLGREKGRNPRVTG